jgi:hypothetical protein
VPAKSETSNTRQKALEVNLDPSKYGVFAEIGAGQEVARWFFRVGGAAGTIEGLAAIKQWEAETKRKYQHTIEPLTCAEKDGKIIVTNQLTGNFPGSPIKLDFVFTLTGDKIAALEILS